jgi:HEAT repeat protein
MMEHSGDETFDLKKMIADYMEGGLLDNIIDMFKHDESLYVHIAPLLTDERMRVRLGATILVESLAEQKPESIPKVLPYILPLLKDQNPVTRGDAAYLLGRIGKNDIVRHLEEITEDEDPNVRNIAREAIDDIISASKPV